MSRQEKRKYYLKKKLGTFRQTRGNSTQRYTTPLKQKVCLKLWKKRNREKKCSFCGWGFWHLNCLWRLSNPASCQFVFNTISQDRLLCLHHAAVRRKMDSQSSPAISYHPPPYISQVASVKWLLIGTWGSSEGQTRICCYGVVVGPPVHLKTLWEVGRCGYRCRNVSGASRL